MSDRRATPDQRASLGVVMSSSCGPDGNYDRLVGIEMALDGALNSLSSNDDVWRVMVSLAIHLGASERADPDASTRRKAGSSD